MADEHTHHHHHHHHHKKDGATRFKERSLNAIAFRRKFEKYLKLSLIVLSLLLVLAVLFLYTIG
jgi:hypothetical protein